MLFVEDLGARIDDLACLIDEFKLAEASLHGDGWKVAFKKVSARPARTKESVADEVIGEASGAEEAPAPAPVAEIPAGIPVSSPMNGIFYSSPSPSAPPFVKEGESVSAGQVVALIEAMKVFNEITAPTSGTVLKVLAETGQVVQPGEPLLYIG